LLDEDMAVSTQEALRQMQRMLDITTAKDEILQQDKEALNAREAIVRDREHVLHKKEAELHEFDVRLRHREHVLNKKEAELHEFEARLLKSEAELSPRRYPELLAQALAEEGISDSAAPRVEGLSQALAEEGISDSAAPRLEGQVALEEGITAEERIEGSVNMDIFDIDSFPDTIRDVVIVEEDITDDADPHRYDLAGPDSDRCVRR
jgi:hypothetical protein